MTQKCDQILPFISKTYKSRKIDRLTKIQERVIRKFMKLARSKETQKLFEKDPCKIFTDRYLLVRKYFTCETVVTLKMHVSRYLN